MSKNKNKNCRKTHSDKFQLTLHKTGQYCKKIGGKIYYFGKIKPLSLKKYIKETSSLMPKIVRFFFMSYPAF